MAEPDLKDWLPIVFERANAATALWNVEITAILGIIAFVAAGGDLARHGYVRALLAGGFVVMAALNLSGLIAVNEQRAALVDFVRSLHGGRTDALLAAWSEPTFVLGPFKIGPLLIPPTWLLIVSHLVPDAFVLWFLAKFKRANA